MTKKIAARIISTTDRENYADVEVMNQIRLTRHNIISANRRNPLRASVKLVQLTQQPGVEKHLASTIA